MSLEIVIEDVCTSLTVVVEDNPHISNTIPLSGEGDNQFIRNEDGYYVPPVEWGDIRNGTTSSATQVDETVEQTLILSSQVEVLEGIAEEHTTQIASLEQSKVDVVAGKQLSDQNYTLAEKNKLSILENYDDTAVLLSLNNKVDKVSGRQLSTEDFTSALKDKLIGLEGAHWRGTFVSLAALQAGVTDPEAGDYADVDAVGDDVVRYIWDATDGIWVVQRGEVAPITASQVKLLYESNPDTNAFTDADEAKLGDVQPWATAPTQNAARQNLGLGTAATKNAGTGVGNVMEVGAFGLGSSGRPPVLLDINDLNSTRIFRYRNSSVGFPTGFGSGLYLHGSDEGSGYANILLTDYSASKYYIMRKFAGVWFTDELIHTGNILTSTGNSTTYPMTQKAVTDVLDTKMDVGTGGWLGRASPNSYISGYPQDISQNVSQIYRRDSVDEGVSAFASSIHFAANDTWGRLRVGHNNQRAWIQGGTDLGGTGWTAELCHTGNTTVDSNGFLKSASPIIKLHSDRVETEAPAVFNRIDTGHYQLTGCNGLRLDDGWHIETPHDRNGNKYFNVEWYQDVEPATDKGVLDEAADVALSIHCYERVWNPSTGTWDNGEPVDIPEGRWIDLRMNEVRQPELDIPDEGTRAEVMLGLWR